MFSDLAKGIGMFCDYLGTIMFEPGNGISVTVNRLRDGKTALGLSQIAGAVGVSCRLSVPIDVTGIQQWMEM